MSRSDLTRFLVTLKFTDGESKRIAWGRDAEQAAGLALTDARMGSPQGTFYGKLLHHEATPAPG